MKMFFSNVHPARKKKCMPLKKKKQYWKIKPQVVCGNKQRQGNATGNERQGVWGGGEETQKTEQNQQGGRALTSLPTTYKCVCATVSTVLLIYRREVPVSRYGVSSHLLHD